MIEFEELVREKIPDILVDNGFDPNTRVLSEHEYLEELKKKILEELLAYLDDGYIENLIEVYDLLEEIFEVNGINYDELQEFRYNYYIEKGSYKKRVYLINAKRKRY